VSLLRRLRIAAPAQLTLAIDELVAPADRWWSLPEDAQLTIVRILARMIAEGVVVTDEEVSGDDAHH
jgi:hypothetical protein